MTTNDPDKFEYIVVGGGTAGLAVASRLTEDDSVSVLVVEAGADHRDDPTVLTPGFVAFLCGNDKYDWNFKSVPQVSSCAHALHAP
jgi:choline dehydrogenase-like flavoprotein